MSFTSLLKIKSCERLETFYLGVTFLLKFAFLHASCLRYFWCPDCHSLHKNLIFGGILVVAGIAGTVCGGWLADRLRDRVKGSYFVVSGVAMLVDFPLWITALYVPFPYAWGFIFGACFCLFFSTGPTNTILANVTHPAIRASAFALNILVIHSLGDVISPMVIGAVADATGGNMNTAFMVVSAFILLSGVIWLFGARHLAADTAKVADTTAQEER